jgi:hypothetical protein
MLLVLVRYLWIEDLVCDFRYFCFTECSFFLYVRSDRGLTPQSSVMFRTIPTHIQMLTYDCCMHAVVQ